MRLRRAQSMKKRIKARGKAPLCVPKEFLRQMLFVALYRFKYVKFVQEFFEILFPQPKASVGSIV